MILVPLPIFYSMLAMSMVGTFFLGFHLIYAAFEAVDRWFSKH